jgi:hypothetical protein
LKTHSAMTRIVSCCYAVAVTTAGIRQPITATYPIDQVKEAVAHAIKGGKILLRLSDG